MSILPSFDGFLSAYTNSHMDTSGSLNVNHQSHLHVLVNIKKKLGHRDVSIEIQGNSHYWEIIAYMHIIASNVCKCLYVLYICKLI